MKDLLLGCLGRRTLLNLVSLHPLQRGLRPSEGELHLLGLLELLRYRSLVLVFQFKGGKLQVKQGVRMASGCAMAYQGYMHGGNGELGRVSGLFLAQLVVC